MDDTRPPLSISCYIFNGRINDMVGCRVFRGITCLSKLYFLLFLLAGHLKPAKLMTNPKQSLLPWFLVEI